MAYKTFVRPIVEYAATTLAPFTESDTRKIETVHRSASRLVSNDYRHTSSVTEMISNLGWNTLQKRRDLLVDIPVEPYLTPSTSLTRGYDSRFFVIKTSNTTELLSKNRRLVEPTPSDCSKSDNAGGLPEQAGHPHLLNATPVFFLSFLTV